MDSPALVVAVAMVVAGAIGTLGGLAIAGLQWQATPTDIDPEELAAAVPAVPVSAAARRPSLATPRRPAVRAAAARQSAPVGRARRWYRRAWGWSRRAVTGRGAPGGGARSRRVDHLTSPPAAVRPATTSGPASAGTATTSGSASGRPAIIPGPVGGWPATSSASVGAPSAITPGSVSGRPAGDSLPALRADVPALPASGAAAAVGGAGGELAAARAELIAAAAELDAAAAQLDAVVTMDGQAPAAGPDAQSAQLADLASAQLADLAMAPREPATAADPRAPGAGSPGPVTGQRTDGHDRMVGSEVGTAHAADDTRPAAGQLGSARPAAFEASADQRAQRLAGGPARTPGGAAVPRPRRSRRGRRGQEPQPVTPGSAALQRRTIHLGAYALAAAERAAAARAAADAAVAEANRAQAARDEAWRVLESADAAPLPAAPAARPVTVDPAVTQAAFAAFRRGDITVDELRRVWGRPEDRDPDAAEREREQRRRAALVRAARRAYEQAAATARTAQEQARVAEVAALALAGEAEEAAREAAAVTTG